MTTYTIDHNIIVSWKRIAVYARDTTDPKTRTTALNDIINDFDMVFTSYLKTPEKTGYNVPEKELKDMEGRSSTSNLKKPGFLGRLKEWIE